MTTAELEARLAVHATPGTSHLTSRRARAREAAPKWTVRTRDRHGQWTARYVCLTPGEAASRWGSFIAAGRVADVITPKEHQ